jgi:hypothetical protein
MNPPSPGSGLLPSVVVLDELRDGLVRQHLPDPVKRFSVKLEGLLEQHLVLHAPLVREGSEIGQVLKNKIRKSKNLIYYLWLRIDSRLTRVKTQYLVSQKKNWHFSALVLNGSALASNSSFDISQNTY